MSFAFLLPLHAPATVVDDVLRERPNVRRGRDDVDPRPRPLPVSRERHDPAFVLDALVLRQIG